MNTAVETVIATIQMGVPMARIEFVDDAMVSAFNSYAGAELPAAPHLLVEFHGTDEAVAGDVARFRELAQEMGALGFDWAERAEDRTALWTMRHNAHYASLSLRPGARALVTDICVPISRLAEAVEETRADIAEMPFPGTILGHVGDGNFHAEVMFDDQNPAEVQAVKAFSDRIVERALRLGGTSTGEHGVGAGKIGFMEAEHGPAWGVMGQIKQALDPQNIMNPGKVVRLT
jgi:D-lactate dehydrogenase (cytochrome)